MLLVLGLHTLDPVGEVRDVDGQLEDVVGDLLVFGARPFDDVGLDLVDLVGEVVDGLCLRYEVLLDGVECLHGLDLVPLGTCKLVTTVLEVPEHHLCLGHLETVLDGQVLGGRLHVFLERVDLTGQLVEDEGDAVQVFRGHSPLGLSTGYVCIVTCDTGDAVENAPPLDTTHLDDPCDVTLLDQIVTVCADPCLGEEILKLGECGLLVVDEEMRGIVLAVGGHLDVTGQPHGRIVPWEDPIGIVEHQ